MKFDLGILCEIDSQGCYHRLKDIRLKIVNDEIIITDSKNKAFSYTLPAHEDIESHRIQKALFENKKALIESCLFGVDINPNSCEITKLRLWIELLKHSYYKNIATKELETLPNIDINIKCGNSLISNFELWEVDKNQKAKKGSLRYLCENDREFANNIRQKIKDYKSKINAYKDNLGIKENLRKDIESIKNFFRERLVDISDEMELFKANIESYIKNFGDNDFDIESDFGFEVLKIKRKNNYAYEATLGMDDEFMQKPNKEKLFNALLQSYNDLQDLRQKESFEWRFEFPEVLDSNGNFVGFDLIIGNPPYIRHEEIKHLKSELSKHFSIYTGKSDIYTYFYELGFRLLKAEGVLSLITSNKWCRTGYGKALRGFILKNTALLQYIDFNGVKVFESATVDTSITSFLKATKKDNAFTYLAFTEANLKDCKEDIHKNKDFKFLKQNDLSTESFTFADPTIQALKKKIEKIGTPLKDWDISINYGIKTGYNEAFIIDSAKREEILSSCKDEEERKRTAELIKPILRGRDIKRYSYEWAGLWIINTHNGYVSEVSHTKSLDSKTQANESQKIKIPPIDINDYPTLKKHFDEIANNGKQTKGKGFYNRDDKGITPYNLRNCAYINEFAKPKIVYSEIVREPQFYLDSGEFKFGNFYAEATAFILSGNENFKNSLEYLLGILHSKLATFAFKAFYAGGGLGESGYRYKKAFLEKLPIPKISQNEEKEFVKLVREIIESKANNQDSKVQKLEQDLDIKVCKLYGLSQDERELLSLSLS